MTSTILCGTGLKTNLYINFILGGLLLNMAGAAPLAGTPPPYSPSNTPTIFDFEVQDSYFEPKALDLFIDYENSLRQGRFDESAATLTIINMLLPTENERIAFWQKVIPDPQRRTLTIAQICPDCLTGYCLNCHGKGICLACQGKKQCSVCKGKKSFAAPCKACRCKTCSANGLCPKCRGYKTVKCPTCLGSGMGKQTANGTPMCPQCNGKCRITCPQCAGNGKCPVCAGTGHTGACPQCHDTGIIVTTCIACNGTGECLSCNNTGICQACKGNGICPRCNQNVIITHYRFPVNADWMRLQTGYILHQELPVITNQIIKKSGDFRVSCGSRKISLNIKTYEIQCVANSEQFDWVKNQALK